MMGIRGRVMVVIMKSGGKRIEGLLLGVSSFYFCGACG
jgi:hypothetical protein